MAKATEFDFDHWAALARNNPARFERDRRAAIARLLRQVPPPRRQRLRGLQWRIDQVRCTARTPLAACIRLSQMMWDSVHGERGLAATLRQPASRARQPAAQVLAFPGRRGA